MVGELREWLHIQAAPPYLWRKVCYVVRSEWSSAPRRKWFHVDFIGSGLCEMRVSPRYLRLCTRPVKDPK